MPVGWSIQLISKEYKPSAVLFSGLTGIGIVCSNLTARSFFGFSGFFSTATAFPTRSNPAAANVINPRRSACDFLHDLSISILPTRLVNQTETRGPFDRFNSQQIRLVNANLTTSSSA